MLNNRRPQNWWPFVKHVNDLNYSGLTPHKAWYILTLIVDLYTVHKCHSASPPVLSKTVSVHNLLSFWINKAWIIFYQDFITRLSNMKSYSSCNHFFNSAMSTPTKLYDPLCLSFLVNFKLNYVYFGFVLIFLKSRCNKCSEFWKEVR